MVALAKCCLEAAVQVLVHRGASPHLVKLDVCASILIFCDRRALTVHVDAEPWPLAGVSL